MTLPASSSRDSLNGSAVPTPEPKLLPLSSLLDDWQRDAEAAFEARVSGKPRGPVTGLPRLDTALGDWLQPGVHILHGQPGAGKTAFALQVAGSCGCPALYVTAEMSPLELLRRITARITSTYLGRLKSGEFPPEKSLSLARQAVVAVPHLTIADATQVFAEPAWIEQAARARRGEGRHLLIVVDSVHSWAEGAAGEASEYDALNAALARLRGIAARLECPILAVAERNRASMKDGGLSAGAGSRKIEYGAETVLDLGRKQEEGKDKGPDGAGEVEIHLSIAKNRNGAASGPKPLRFHGALQRFREV